MPSHEDPVNWQPTREMSLIARMIDGTLDDTREHLKTLAEARLRPHVLDESYAGEWVMAE